ncbi:MAG: hypothetical protein ACREQJ_08285 [Candidatus Binatia bacterium]
MPPVSSTPMPSEKNANDGPKWWIDTSRASTEGRRDDSIPPAIARFYVTTKGYEQDRARAGLVDLNLKILREANPEEGELAYLPMIAERAPADVVERIRRTLRPPPGARGVIVDSGRMVRAILTGTPVGERILEFNFNRGDPSFDVWVANDWKEERVYRGVNELHRRAAELIAKYLSPEAMAKRDFFA